MTKDKLSNLIKKINSLHTRFIGEFSSLNRSISRKYWRSIENLIKETKDNKTLYEELKKIVKKNKPKCSLKENFPCLCKKESTPEINHFRESLIKTFEEISTCLRNDK